MLHRAWPTGDETFYLTHALNIVGTDKWKSLLQYGAEEAHAIFDYDHDRDCYWLRDLSAKTGVRVNGIPISKAESVRLKSGDRIAFARSPDYTFLATAVAPVSAERKQLSTLFHPNSSYSRSSRLQHHSFDDAIENVDYSNSNLAVDSAPSVNGTALGTFHSLPRLNRGRSPTSRRAVSQLPVATLIDGRRIEDGADDAGDVTNTRSARHSPTTLTYRQRHFLRHASVESNSQASPTRNIVNQNRRTIPNAWEDSRDGKDGRVSSPSSSGSYGGGTRNLTQRRGSAGNGSGFMRTHQSTIIRQLQKRVQQLEEALRINHHDVEGVVHGADSGISSAASGPGNTKLTPHNDHHLRSEQHRLNEINNVERHLSDDNEHQEILETQSDLELSNTARELRRLRTALAASERRRAKLEGMVENKDSGHIDPTQNSVYDEPAVTTSIELSDDANTPHVIPPTPNSLEQEQSVKMNGEQSLNVSFSSSEPSANFNEYNLERQISNNDVPLIAEINNDQLLAPAVRHKRDLRDTASTCDWSEFLKEANEDEEDDEEPVGAVEVINTAAAMEEAAGKGMDVDAQSDYANEAVTLANHVIEESKTELDAQLREEQEGNEVDHSLQKYQLNVIFLLQSIFADEIAALPDKFFDNPLFDFDQLTAMPMEEKMKLYKNELRQMITESRSDDETNFGTNEDFLDQLCAWAVEKCKPIVEATQKLMPRIVGLLKRCENEHDAQKTLQSWLKDFQMQYEKKQLDSYHLREAADLLQLYGSDYWQLNFLVSLLTFIAEKGATEKSGDNCNKSDVEMNTDISHEDFSKLVSDIADLLDEKEQLKSASSELQNDLVSKCNDFDQVRNQFNTLETDYYLLQNDNRHLIEGKLDLVQRITELEDRMQNAVAGTEESEKLQSLMASNLHYQERISELESEKEQLKQELHRLTQSVTEEMEAQSTARNLDVSNQEEQPEEKNHNEVEALDHVSSSAREELEYLKRKLEELEKAALGNEASANREPADQHAEESQYLEELETERGRLEKEVTDLSARLAEKDDIAAQLEQRLADLENENVQLKLTAETSAVEQTSDEHPSNSGSIDGPLQSASSKLQLESTDAHTARSNIEESDNMFWTLSDRLASLLNLDINHEPFTTEHADTVAETSSIAETCTGHKNPLQTAHEIADKVQELLDRVRRQNEELVTYRSAASGNLDDSMTLENISTRPPPYLAPMLANGHAHMVKESMNGDIISGRRGSNEEKSLSRRSRSGSVKFRRHRSPSPQSSTNPHSAGHNSSSHHGGRECHACDILKARRRQQELMQAAKMQATALASRQLDAYPLKIVTFKLPTNRPLASENDDNESRNSL